MWALVWQILSLQLALTCVSAVEQIQTFNVWGHFNCKLGWIWQPHKRQYKYCLICCKYKLENIYKGRYYFSLYRPSLIQTRLGRRQFWVSLVKSSIFLMNKMMTSAGRCAENVESKKDDKYFAWGVYILK